MELALLRARDAERRSIARDLHDVTAQLLLRLEFNLHAISTADSAVTDIACKDAGDVVTQLQQQVRCVAYLLHPPELETLGLPGALDALAAGMSARTGIEIGFKCRGNQGKNSKQTEMSLFRIAQEALMNVFKHSGARRAEMRLHCSGNWLCLRIRDFGVGIATGRGLDRNSGVGINGMKSRMAELGGRIRVRPLENGTSVTAVVRDSVSG
ncbi:sensor histidine kinase [Novosphingobium album (ex Hu et al. 2023)]|uniref:histidine kinase n=1 Tax=Novosphingobium album (ex Hu et al. 2023) TaxID=2930093 RepID=A0ABT0B010_9SPHN|nr:ATP-binding protein [Novosphingobium album (ex Hu et al. 2023)]MCJ2178386.1 histidine kinase [Novosphingobium album (ex Hu et al. 2023)]